MIRIAIVEDNADLLDDLAFNLQLAGYAVAQLSDGIALDAWLADYEAEVLVLDIGLPGEDGLSIVARLRRSRPRMGIVLLTARSALGERIQGLETGADAYLAKPADMRELAAVVRCVARRLGVSQECPATGSRPTAWTIKPSQLKLIPPGGQPIPLSHNELRVLKAAAGAKGNIVSRKDLIEALGQNYWHYDERRLETLISRLRRKLATCMPEGFPVRGVKGHGYLFGINLRETHEEV